MPGQQASCHRDSCPRDVPGCPRATSGMGISPEGRTKGKLLFFSSCPFILDAGEQRPQHTAGVGRMYSPRCPNYSSLPALSGERGAWDTATHSVASFALWEPQPCHQILCVVVPPPTSPHTFCPPSPAPTPHSWPTSPAGPARPAPFPTPRPCNLRAPPPEPPLFLAPPI